jgi:hypothetical protein
MAFTDDITDLNDTLFAEFGEPAIYTPADGDPVEVLVIPSEPDEVVSVGRLGAILPVVMVDVRMSEIGSPQSGDALTWNGQAYTLTPPRRDGSGTVWKLGLNEASA